jgi:hypothetical protein
MAHLISNSPSRSVYHPHKCRLGQGKLKSLDICGAYGEIWILRQLQVSKHIFDFGPLEEFMSAYYTIWYTVLLEGRFDDSR